MALFAGPTEQLCLQQLTRTALRRALGANPVAQLPDLLATSMTDHSAIRRLDLPCDILRFLAYEDLLLRP